MKKRFLSICAAAIAVSFVACTNNEGSTSDTGDTSTTSTTNTTTTDVNATTTTTTSETSYAAMADSVEKNSQSGYYLNPKTGKPYKSLKVDRTTGRITDDAGQPVWRYVDNRNWWVYGDDGMDSMSTWGQVGEAKMQGEKLMYKGDGDQWTDYDSRWKKDDSDKEMKWKSKDGETKIKVEKDGDMKIKQGDEKIKIDEDGVKKKN